MWTLFQKPLLLTEAVAQCLTGSGADARAGEWSEPSAHCTPHWIHEGLCTLTSLSRMLKQGLGLTTALTYPPKCPVARQEHKQRTKTCWTCTSVSSTSVGWKMMLSILKSPWIRLSSSSPGGRLFASHSASLSMAGVLAWAAASYCLFQVDT